MSIRLKLIIMFMAIALIPLFLVSMLTFHNYKDSIEQARLSQLQDIITFKADKIETYFDSLKTHIGVTQSSYVIKKNLPVLFRLANDPANPEFIAARKMVDEVYQHMPPILGLVDIMLAGPSGKVVYSSNPAHYAKEFLEVLSDPGEKAFKEGKDKIYISDIFLDKTMDNKPAMLVTAPAAGLNGTFAGVIVFQVDMGHMYKFVLDVTGLGKTGETLIGKLKGGHVVFLNPLRHGQQAVLETHVALDGALGGPIQEAVKGKTGAGQLIDYRGEEVIAAWRYLPSLGWGVVSKIDTQEAFIEAINLRNLVFIILGIIIVLSGIMAFSIAQSISNPIQELSKGAQVIGTGNLDYKVATNSKDEIGQLSRTFDKMVQDLKVVTASHVKLDEKIKFERQRFNDVLNMLPAYVVLLSPDYRVPFANRFFEERFGKSHGKCCYDYLFKRTEPCDNCETFKVLKTNAPHHWEWTGPDNRNYDIYDFPFKDADGSPLIMEMGIDITDQKKAQAELKRINENLEQRVEERTVTLRESEERLSRSQEIAHLGGWELDLVNNKLLWSDEVYRIFGLKPQEFGATYEAFLEAIHPDDRAAVNDAYSGSLREGKDSYEIEHRVVKKSTGEIRFVHEKCTHFRDESGKVIRSVGMVHDITERKQAEEEIKRSNENLEQFAYVASHDLQEPLRIMASYSQLLEQRYKTKLDSDASDFINYIVDAAKRMQRLITDLLAYSRIGRIDVEINEVDCNVVLGKVIYSLDPLIKESNAIVTNDTLPVATCNESNFTQLFQNLIGNALKFRGDTPPRIHVSAKKERGEWLFSVRDNGIGIEDKYKDRIFLIFQRLHGRDKYPGTGIGLSICKKIVETYGGRIWIESEMGKGTTFYFTIPVKSITKNQETMTK